MQTRIETRPFDVAGHITLNDVKYPTRGETAGQRVTRLARKAVIQGVELIPTSRPDRLLASSATQRDVFYLVNTTERTCNCHGFTKQRHNPMCMHLALGLMSRRDVIVPDAA